MTAIIVHRSRMEDFTTRLEKLAKKAKRLGQPEPQVCQKIERRVRIGTTRLGQPIYTSYWHVDITDANPMLPGHELLAVVDATEGGNLLRPLPAHREQDLVDFRHTSPERCDHCNNRRQRNRAFVLRNEAGEMLQVGSTCLKSYLGEDCLRSLAYALEVSEDDDWHEPRGKDHSYYETRDSLVLVSVIERAECFVSRKDAQFGGYESTSDKACRLSYCLQNRGVSGVEKMLREDFTEPLRILEGEGLKFHEDRVDAMLAWLEEQDANNDYMHNLKVVVACSEVPNKGWGILASLVPVYLRDECRRIERENTVKINEYFGAVGDKVGRKLTAKDKRAGKSTHPALRVKLLMLKGIETDYGYSTLVKMRSDEGHTFAWFASGSLGEDFVEGDHVMLVGTIRGHREYQEQKETQLSRCVLEGTK